MRVLVHGAGAVGLGLGSFLLQGGAEPCFVTRPGIAAALRAHGLARSGRFGDCVAPPSRLRAASSLAELAAPVDFVLVTTKSFDSDRAGRELARCDAALGAPPVVLCQNGWGNAEAVRAHLPAERIWNARVITGFVLRVRSGEPVRVEITAHAEPVAIGSLLGEDAARVEPLCEALRRGGLPAAGTDRIAEILWEKLLYNGCLNALGAILGVPYGTLGASQPSRAILADVAAEIFAVMAAAGYRTRWPDAAAFLRSLHGELLPPTAAHESSTLQDLRAGKRTEIDALNGAVVRLGAEHGVAAPVNATLCRLVEALGRGAPQEGRGAPSR